MLLSTYGREHWGRQDVETTSNFASSVTDLFRNFHYISGLVIHLKGRQDTRARRNIEVYRSILDDAAMVFDGDWRGNFRHVIQTFEHRPSQLGDPSLDRIFPYLFRSLNAGPDARWKDPLREVFWEFVREQHPQTFVLATRLRRRKQQLRIDDLFFTLPEASAKLGVRPAVARRILEDIGEAAAIVRWTARQTHRRVSQAQIDLMRSAIDENPKLYLGQDSSIDRKKDDARRLFLLETGSDLNRVCSRFRAGTDFPRMDIAVDWPRGFILAAGWITDRLGISSATLTEIQRARLIRSERVLRYAERGVRIDDYAEFEKRLATKVRQSPEDLREPVPLLAISKLISSFVPVSALLEAILEGSLVAGRGGAGEAGLSRIIVPRTDAMRLSDEWRHSRVRGACDKAQVARMLWLSDESIVTRMAELGLLTPHERSGHGRKLLFSRREIEKFSAEHISLKEIARRELFGRASAPSIARSWLAKRGILPVCAPDVNGVAVVFFKRSDVESPSWRR